MRPSTLIAGTSLPCLFDAKGFPSELPDATGSPMGANASLTHRSERSESQHPHNDHQGRDLAAESCTIRNQSNTANLTLEVTRLSSKSSSPAKDRVSTVPCSAQSDFLSNLANRCCLLALQALVSAKGSFHGSAVNRLSRALRSLLRTMSSSIQEATVVAHTFIGILRC